MKTKILIADDERPVRNLLSRVFDADGVELYSAADGNEALDVISAQSPDIVLLDVAMPEKNGLDVLTELRRDLRTRMMPVILITAEDRRSQEIRGLDMGADDYITKPFDIDELRARVASLLRRNRAALAASPLTRLPGSPMIEEEVRRRIEQQSPFAFFYCDINRFKSYNDAYGYERGNQVIRATSEMLADSLREAGETEGFLGHIGGDDFVLICDPSRAAFAVQTVVSRFDDLAPNFYDLLARRLGFIELKNRVGKWERFPLISVSVGVVTTQRRKLEQYAKVVEIASEMKAYCKSLPGQLSRFAFDRRKDA